MQRPAEPPVNDPSTQSDPDLPGRHGRDQRPLAPADPGGGAGTPDSSEEYEPL